MLLRAKRKWDIGMQVALYTNRMSKCAVEHNMRLADIVTDLVNAISSGGQVIHATASNLPQMKKTVALVLSGGVGVSSGKYQYQWHQEQQEEQQQQGQEEVWVVKNLRGGFQA